MITLTPSELLFFIVDLLFITGLGIVAFILNEILIDVRELKAKLEER